MNAARPGGGQIGPKSIASVEDAIDALAQFRLHLSYQWKVLAQDAQFVSHGVRSFDRHAGAVELVNRLGDAAGQSDSLRSGQKLARESARNFSLQPDLELRQDADWFRHGNSIRAIGLKSGIPNRLQQTIAFVAIAPRPDFAD